MSDNKDDFNLLNEWARGIMYRGGEEQRDFVVGYFWGMGLYGALFFILFVIGVLLGK